MSTRLACRCGLVQGQVDGSHTYGRAVCYCTDCQAFARFLGRPQEILNRQGGSDIVATHPQHVQFTQGFDHVACMSLSPRGLLRWYAACCQTAIGNTPRDPGMAYVGLLTDCLSATDNEIDTTFGRATVAIKTESAHGEVKATPVATFFAVLKIMGNVALARLGGSYRRNPFFVSGTAQPVKPLKVLNKAERQAL